MPVALSALRERRGHIAAGDSSLRTGHQALMGICFLYEQTGWANGGAKHVAGGRDGLVGVAGRRGRHH